ncbi:MAG: AAA family ATPase [Gammaproteobacteria bacterium]
MTDELARTFGELKASGYQVLPVKAEIRRNLINRLRDKEPLFPGVVGYDETVIPQLTNAILGSQDIIFLGERGQAKSRMVRSLTSLLDEYTPVIEGTEIPAEKLATPDITIADLIGEVDPIKVAEGRYLSDELTLHYGLVPRVNRGIFAINELPDLAERIQVGLLNLLEERDVQIRGHKVRLPLDVFIVATANPEDYTNRGRIITPLKDRYGAQIRTHYPVEIEEEIAIMDQEASILDLGDYHLNVPDFMKEIIAEITHHARHSPDINQRSGVSVRTSISNYEALVANAFRRALRLGEAEVVPRISDLEYVIPSLMGKIEFEAMEEGQEDKITARIIQGAVKDVFDRHYDVNDLEPVAMAFNEGLTVETGEAAPAEAYGTIAERIPALNDIFPDRDTVSNTVRATVIEFVLEGLHLHKLLNKFDHAGKATYTG